MPGAYLLLGGGGGWEGALGTCDVPATAQKGAHVREAMGSVGGGREAQAEPQVPWGWMGWPALLEGNLESSPELLPPLMSHLPPPSNSVAWPPCQASVPPAYSGLVASALLIPVPGMLFPTPMSPLQADGFIFLPKA